MPATRYKLSVPCAMVLPVIVHANGKLDRPDDPRLRETIATYDAIAVTYARRFDPVDLHDARTRFETDCTSRRVLDAGCGPGRDCRLLRADGFAPIGMDVSKGMLDLARRTGPMPLVRGDVRALPFRPNSFGGVWCCAVLLHLDPSSTAQAIREFHRVIEPGGALFVSVAEGAGSHWRASDGGRRRWFQPYRENEIAALVRSSGFRTTAIETVPGALAGTWVNVEAVKC